MLRKQLINLLLETAFSFLRTIVTSQIHSQEEVVNIIAKFVYLSAPILEEVSFKTHKSVVCKYLVEIQTTYQCFNNNLSKLHELLIYCCYEKYSEKVTDKDAAVLSENERYEVVKRVVVSLINSFQLEDKAHGYLIAQKAMTGFLKQNPQAIYELYSIVSEDFALLAKYYQMLTKFFFEDIYILVKKFKRNNSGDSKEFIKKMFMINRKIGQDIYNFHFEGINMKDDYNLQVPGWVEEVFDNYSEEYVSHVETWLPIICSKVEKTQDHSKVWFSILKGLISKNALPKEDQDLEMQKKLRQTAIRKLFK